MELVVQQAAFAADQVRVEVIRLQAINGGCALGGGAALEFEDRYARGRILVGGEQLAPGPGVVAHDLDHIAAHEEQQRVHRVAAGFEQGAAAFVLSLAPAELVIPRADAVIVIHLAIVHVAQQPPIQHGLGDLELVGVAALEADAGLDPGPLHGLVHGPQLLERKAERLFEDEMLARPGGADNLVQTPGGETAQGDDMNIRIGEHLVQVVIDADAPAVLGAERRRIELARRTHGRDLGEAGPVDGRDMRCGHPAVTDDADVILLHGSGAGLYWAVTTREMAQSFGSFVKSNPITLSVPPGQRFPPPRPRAPSDWPAEIRGRRRPPRKH